jgi:nucleotide-binding universal stress UspA family protein
VFGSIVVGTDGSATAGKAVSEAAALAARLSAELHVVSAYAPLSGVHARGTHGAGGDTAGWGADPEMDVRGVLDRAVGACHAAGAECEVYARRGDAASVILELAQELDADLIVIGNKGMSGNRRFLLGSVPDKISHHAGCSVLIVQTMA